MPLSVVGEAHAAVREVVAAIYGQGSASHCRSPRSACRCPWSVRRRREALANRPDGTPKFVGTWGHPLETSNGSTARLGAWMGLGTPWATELFPKTTKPSSSRHPLRANGTSLPSARPSPDPSPPFTKNNTSSKTSRRLKRASRHPPRSLASERVDAGVRSQNPMILPIPGEG